MSRDVEVQELERRLPDRCEKCGQFVGIYPTNFYADRFCGGCYFEMLDDGPPSWFKSTEDGYARERAWAAGESMR